MTSRTADLMHDVTTVELGEEDANDFMERLDEFRATLPDQEQAILAVMALEAAGESIPATGEGTLSEPTDEEMAAFAAKLDRFHDELPGNQHLYVDHMLAKTWFVEQAEVQGYGWELIGKWFLIPKKNLPAWRAACADPEIGGEGYALRRKVGGKPAPPGKTYFGCFNEV